MGKGKKKERNKKIYTHILQFDARKTKYSKKDHKTSLYIYIDRKERERERYIETLHMECVNMIPESYFI